MQTSIQHQNTPSPTIGQSLTPQQFADKWQICRQTVYNMISRGELKTVKAGRCRRIAAEHEALWIEKRSA